ncbi:MAG TPA: hypothetical protein VN797_01015, partial [Gemmatimonadaceae bacterium]|nr:hypothetical protein [Gemmatimonadaceae bacterium]
ERRAFAHHVELCLATVLFAPGTLDFQNHLRAGVNLLSRVDDIGSGCSIGFVGESSAEAGVSLDYHTVTGADKLWNDVRHERDALFTGRYLSGDPYHHEAVFLTVMYGP